MKLLTATEQARAKREGWMLSNNEAGFLQVQKDDDKRIFLSDAAALRFVKMKPRTDLHKKAQAIVEHEGATYARLCDICKGGFNEGFVTGNGEEYFCSDKCLHKKYSKKVWAKMHEEDNENNYWSTWEEETDHQYIVKGGELVEIEAPKKDSPLIEAAELLLEDIDDGLHLGESIKRMRDAIETAKKG